MMATLPAISAIVTTGLVLLALVYRLDVPRLMTWLEYRAQTQREAAHSYRTWTEIVRRLNVELEESRKREQGLQKQLQLFAEQLSELRMRCEKTSAIAEELRSALYRASIATAKAKEERDQLQLSSEANGGSFNTKHSQLNPPHGRDDTGTHKLPKRPA